MRTNGRKSRHSFCALLRVLARFDAVSGTAAKCRLRFWGVRGFHTREGWYGFSAASRREIRGQGLGGTGQRKPM